jgi:hypothetical protein
MNANNEGTLGENTYRRKYGWQRKRRVVAEEEKPASPTIAASPTIDFSYGSYEYGSSLPIVRPVFDWMQYYPNLPIAPGLPDLPDRLPDLPELSYELPDLPHGLPDLPELSYELPDLPHGLPDLPKLSYELPDLPHGLPDLPELSYELPDLPHGLYDFGGGIPTRSTGTGADVGEKKYRK